MKVITLNSRVHGTKECLVDDEDYQWLLDHYNIYVCKVQKAFYVDCREKGVSNGPKRKLHRIIWRRHHPLEDGQRIDHHDGSPLNNQKGNLRLATHSQNMINRRKATGTASVFKGVVKHQTGAWYTRVKRDRKYRCVGVFDNERDAAIAYDLCAAHLFGEFAILNVPTATPEDHERVLSRLKDPKRKPGASPYLGVSFNTAAGYWFYSIRKGRQRAICTCGHFATDIEAAKARDAKIDELGLVTIRKCFSERNPFALWAS